MSTEFALMVNALRAFDAAPYRARRDDPQPGSELSLEQTIKIANEFVEYNGDDLGELFDCLDNPKIVAAWHNSWRKFKAGRVDRLRDRGQL